MLEFCKCLQQVGNSFSQADGAGEEHLEAIGWRLAGADELLQTDAVGDDVQLPGWYAFLYEGPGGEAGGHGDGIGHGVELFLAEDVADVRHRTGYAPAAVLVGDDALLITLMGRAAVADEARKS